MHDIVKAIGSWVRQIVTGESTSRRKLLSNLLFKAISHMQQSASFNYFSHFRNPSTMAAISSRPIFKSSAFVHHPKSFSMPYCLAGKPARSHGMQRF